MQPTMKGISMNALGKRNVARRAPAVIAAAVLAGAGAHGRSLRGRRTREPRNPIAGFVLDEGRYRTIEHPDAATQTYAFGNDDRGRIVGLYDDADGGCTVSCVSETAATGRSTAPGPTRPIATRINDRGQITGDCFTTKERFEQGLKRGFLLDRGRFITVNVPGSDSTEAVGLDNRGRVVGETGTLEPFDLYGYLWEDGRITRIDVPGADVTGAEEINERGQIAGTYGDDPARVATRGYLLDKGKFRTFAAPGGPVTQVFGLNNRGQIAGYVAADDQLNDAHGFLLLAKGVGGPFTQVDVPGALRTIALGINDEGQVVGTFERDGNAATRTRGMSWSRVVDLVRAGGRGGR